MDNSHVHPIFQPFIEGILHANNGKIPTSEGDKAIPEIMDHLTYCSYRANRGYGCTHEQLINIGIGNDAMKQRYENEIKK